MYVLVVFMMMQELISKWIMCSCLRWLPKSCLDDNDAMLNNFINISCDFLGICVFIAMWN